MKKSRFTLIATTSFLCASSVVFSQAIWNGSTSNDWNTGSNWTSGTGAGGVPGTNQEANINLSGANVTTSGQVGAPGAPISHVRVQATGTAPVLNIGHDFYINDANRHLKVGGGADNQGGIVNHSAGLVDAARIVIAADNASSGTNRTGTYNFTGGSIALTDQINIGQRSGDTGILNLSGTGSIAVADELFIGQFGGTGTLNVIGGNLSISFDQGIMGTGSGAIGAEIDSTGISTLDFIGDFELSNNIDFNLSLGAGYSHTPSTVYTIVDAATFSGDGAFGNVAEGETLTVGGFDFTANYNNTDATFTLTAIPEPSTSALLGAFIVFVMILIRHRRS